MLIGKEIVQSSGASYKLLLLSAINYLANGRIYLLSERSNEQGMLDMGCAPDLLPGHRPVAYAEFRKRYENLWHAEISDKTRTDDIRDDGRCSQRLPEGLVCYGREPGL